MAGRKYGDTLSGHSLTDCLGLKSIRETITKEVKGDYGQEYQHPRVKCKEQSFVDQFLSIAEHTAPAR